MDKDQVCKNCNGTGEQVVHGSFESVMMACGFCGGSGKLSDMQKWLDNKYQKSTVTPGSRTTSTEPAQQAREGDQ